PPASATTGSIPTCRPIRRHGSTAPSACPAAGGRSGRHGSSASAATRFPRRYARARRPTSRSSPRPDDTSRNEPIDLGQQVIPTTQSHQENEMSKKVAYVTGGMGG